MWCGQDVGEVGPIEPLPEHVRQEPYSLPQGCHWVTLTNNNIEELAKFLRKDRDPKANYNFTDAVNYFIMHPNTKHEWQFGIRTHDSKLVGVVLSFPVCISIREVSITCISPVIVNHPKYGNKRLW